MVQHDASLRKGRQWDVARRPSPSHYVLPLGQEWLALECTLDSQMKAYLMSCLTALVWGKILFLQQLNSTDIFLLQVNLKPGFQRCQNHLLKLIIFQVTQTSKKEICFHLTFLPSTSGSLMWTMGILAELPFWEESLAEVVTLSLEFISELTLQGNFPYVPPPRHSAHF